MTDNSIVVVGAGLAGLSAAFELAKAGRTVIVLEARTVLGGRTSSWIDDGMPVESGLHKFLGIYRALPDLLDQAGVNLDDIVEWVDELSILQPHGPSADFTVSPYHHPIDTVISTAGNTNLLPTVEKLKLAKFAVAGSARCLSDPAGLDQVSLADYALQHGVAADVVDRVISTSTQAILFLPANEFSAYAAFAPAVEGLKHLGTMRIGAFKGGMSDVMIAPIVRAIEKRGGEVRQNTAVTELIVENGRVGGVRTGDVELRAGHVILAVPLHAAQQLLRRQFPGQAWFDPMLRLPSLSAATIQFETDTPVLATDRTNFSPTDLCCFAEQSRTTFRHVPGRFSGILYPPEKFVHLPAKEVLEATLSAADSLGLPLRGHVKRFRIVNHPKDFYAMRPGTETLRPEARTAIQGLYLAGDYVKQPFTATMEGAVLAGRAASAALG